MAEEGIRRRTFIGTGAAAAAGALVPGAAEADKKRKRRHRHKHRHGVPKHHVRRVDTVIVGAGLAGLTAARELVRAGKTVVVLEALDRPGGRVHSHRLEGSGELSETGGTFVGPTQNRIIELLGELGIGRFDTYNTGENVYVADGQRSTFSDDAPTGSAPPDPLILADLATVVTRLNEMSKSVPVDAPWTSPSAFDWDRQTLETWIRDNSTTERFREVARLAARPIFGAEPMELSLLFILFYIAASGDERTTGTFERNFNTHNGAQMWRISGTSQTLVDTLHAGLGRRVVLGNPCRELVQENGRVRAEAPRYTVHAKRAIVALPPALAARIDYRPGLPVARDQLGQRLGQGNLTKVAAVYDTPFWRAKGLTGQALSPEAYVSATFDDSPQDGSPGIVFGFVGGDRARSFHRLSPADRREAVLKELATYFGDEAKRPIEYLEQEWAAEPWIRGGPVGIHGPGTLTAYGPALRQPVGRIHWAGTETSTYWNGYMDGAVRSGERAAREVLDEL